MVAKYIRLIIFIWIALIASRVLAQGLFSFQEALKLTYQINPAVFFLYDCRGNAGMDGWTSL